MRGFKNLRVALAAGACMCAIVGEAIAQPAVDFNIPSGELKTALEAYTRQSRQQLIYRTDDVDGLRGVGVRGSLSPAVALDQLLQGTPLSARRDRSGAMVVVRTAGRARGGAGAARAVRQQPQPTPTPTVVQPQEDAAPLTPYRFDEIVVTATRRVSALQDTPISITALSATALDQAGASQFEDIVQMVPGLQVTEVNPGQRRMTIRGIQSTGEATVGLYYNETPVTGPGSANSDASGITPNLNLFDIQRIEVLRGPQGTLFGAGSMGGTMRVLFNAPVMSEYEGLIDASYNSVSGGGQGHSLRGMANVPVIGDILAARLVLYTEERAGWVDNTRLGIDDINSVRTDGARLSVAFEPTANFDLVLSAIYQEQEVRDASAHYPSMGYGVTDAYVRLPYPSDFRLYSGVANWDLGFATATGSASTYTYGGVKYFDNTKFALFSIPTGNFCRLYFDQADACTPDQQTEYTAWGYSQLPLINIQPMEVTSDTAEIRLASNGSNRIDWTVGAFLERRQDYAHSGIYRADAATGEVIWPYQQVGIRTLSSELNQRAAYVDLVFNVTDNLSLNAGVRAFDYDRESVSQVLEPFLTNGGAAGPPNTFTTEESGLTTKFNVSYNFDGGALLYATYSQGFRPGGVNNAPGLPAELIPYGSDSLENYEVGVKFDLLDRRLMVDATLYQINWTDMLIGANMPGYSFITNLGEARTRGLELQAIFRATPDLTFSGSINALKAELMADQLAVGISAPGRVGDELPFEPRFSASLAADYRRPLNNGFDAVLHVGASYTGESYSTLRPLDPNRESMGDFTLFNMRAGLENDVWSASVYVQNLFDEYGILRATSSLAAGRGMSSATTPRTIGLTVRRTF